jgi:lipid A 3-O-deacylase
LKVQLLKISLLFKFISCILLFSTICNSSALSQTKNYKYEIGFKSDNDAYLAINQDRYYTNGLFIYLRKALKTPVDTTHLLKRILSFSVGQKMYNAHSGQTSYIEKVDRPFAGYLYAGTALQLLFRNESVLKAELQIGTIGPAALGKEGQELIHKTFGFYNIDGWQYQVNNEVGINLNLDYQHLLYRAKNKKTDFSLPIQVRLGNTYSGLNTALLFRTGKLNPFYHSTATESTVSQSTEKGLLNNKEFYFFLKPSLDIVFYDATIEGGLFRSDKGPVTFDPIPLVFCQELGAVYSNNRWTFNFSLLFKTREIKSNASADQYGSLGIQYRF